MRHFEWDDEKAEANWRKHGIRFEKATEVFNDPDHFTERDKRFDYTERTLPSVQIGMLRLRLPFRSPP